MLPELVLAVVREYRPHGSPTILLACSGGIDSQVLVHAAAMAWPADHLVVAHVHHGLQPQADDWLAFCGESAARLGLRFMSRRLPPLPEPLRGGVEAWARRQRYGALAEMAAQAGATFVLAAHHANDQLETHQLRRLRGAGPLGLGAMRRGAPLPGAGDRLLLRPFLGVDRQRIVDYAREHGLEWVDDPSNQDLRHARNSVRREMAQALAQDPDRLERGLAEIGGFQQLADTARRQARTDLVASRVVLAARRGLWGLGSHGGGPAGLPEASVSEAGGKLSQDPLSRAALVRLGDERAAEAIRLWLQDLGCRMPSRAALAEIMRQLLHAESTHARLWHDGRWLLRYRDRIDAAAELPVPLAPVWFRWAGEPLLQVAGQQFLFRRQPPAGPAPLEGIDAAWLAGADVLMDSARSSDRLRVGQGGHQRSWKNLVQEHGVAPWARAALPLLRQRGGILYAAPFGMNWHPGTGSGDGEGADTDRIVIEWCAPPGLARWL